jgi:hypothetical protein
LIGGVYSNFGSENAIAIPFYCGPGDPLVTALTPTGFPALFSNRPNDGIVLLTSQQNDLTPNLELQIPDVLHSIGARHLGFTGTSVLEKPSVVTLVIKLLNTPVTNSTYFADLTP